MFSFMRKIKFQIPFPYYFKTYKFQLLHYPLKKKKSKVIKDGGKWKTSNKMVNILDDIDEIILKGLSLWTLTF